MFPLPVCLSSPLGFGWRIVSLGSLAVARARIASHRIASRQIGSRSCRHRRVAFATSRHGAQPHGFPGVLSSPCDCDAPFGRAPACTASASPPCLPPAAPVTVRLCTALDTPCRVVATSFTQAHTRSTPKASCAATALAPSSSPPANHPPAATRTSRRATSKLLSMTSLLSTPLASLPTPILPATLPAAPGLSPPPLRRRRRP